MLSKYVMRCFVATLVCVRIVFSFRMMDSQVQVKVHGKVEMTWDIMIKYANVFKSMPKNAP